MSLTRFMFKQQSLGRKLLMLFMGTCCATMIVAGVGLFAYLNITMRRSFEADSSSLASVIAQNCSGPVAFGDRKAAMETLHTITLQEQVLGACIRLPDGREFGQIGNVSVAEGVKKPVFGSVWMGGSRLLHVCPIQLRDDTIATFELMTDFHPRYAALLKSSGVAFGLTFVCALLLGFVATSRARRLISEPIRTLADAARVAEEGDYSVRAKKAGGGELGEIADAFNVMIERAGQNVALEKEITARRKIEEALRESEERFRAVFDNATVGIFRSGRDGKFLMANATLVAMAGYDSFEHLAAVDTAGELYCDTGAWEQIANCLDHVGLVDGTEIHWRRRDRTKITVRLNAKVIRSKTGGINYYEGVVEDITAQKETAAEMKRLNRELVDASRTAGMAEVATGVLHNIGNVLNTVGVSAQLLDSQLARSKIESLQQAVAILEANLPQLGAFIENDERGKALPDFLIKVTRHIAEERLRLRDEVRHLSENIDHMKKVISTQQGFARVTNALETLSASDIVEDALRMNLPALNRKHILVERDYGEVPHVMVDKHKVLQILNNLIHNARHALEEMPGDGKRLRMKIYKNGSERVKILVEDNGVGIPAENLTRIFSHGFTTRKNGHGFGLHSGALSAKEMNGSLMASSNGVGHGAIFTLELPVAGTK